MSKPRLCDIATQIYKKHSQEIDSISNDKKFRNLAKDIISKHYDLAEEDLNRCIDIIDLLSSRQYTSESNEKLENKIASI